MVAFLILLLVAVVLWIAGSVLLCFRGRAKGKAGVTTGTQTSSAAEVSGLARGAPAPTTPHA